TGKPVVGSAVVSIYDKSVEYISGGSNVPEIKSFFWKWRRSHYPGAESSLYRSGGVVLRNGEIGMGPIGTFGYLVADMEKGKEAERVDQLNAAPGQQGAAFGETRLRGV